MCRRASDNVTNRHQLTSHSTTSCPTTWRSYRDHRLLWRHFTLCIALVSSAVDGCVMLDCLLILKRTGPSGSLLSTFHASKWFRPSRLMSLTVLNWSPGCSNPRDAVSPTHRTQCNNNRFLVSRPLLRSGPELARGSGGPVSCWSHG